ncbi:MAG: protein-export chaperone SecB [Alphaproteobacteria bacterium]|nr:protein-export chaperone SecB [Alphaproteobacteria bacterium]
MSKDDKTNGKAPEENGQENHAGAVPVTIHAQYIRDLSFENPNAPESLRAGQKPPEMEINIGMDARKIPSDQIQNLYEVVLNVRAVARRESDTVFIADLQYGVTVSIHEKVPEDNHHPILLIEIPRLAFPFARQILAAVTVQSGFPPLMLNPIDFQSLYTERYKEEIAQAREKAKQQQEDTVESS